MTARVELVINTGPPPDPTLGDAIALGGAVAVLAFAVHFARERVRISDRPSPRRLARVGATASFFLLAFKIGEVVLGFLQPGIATSGGRNFEDLAFVAVLALILFWLIDRAAEKVRPLRDRFWLLAAPVGFAVVVTVGVYLPAWRWELQAPALGLPAIRLAVSAAAAGLVWAAMLPTRKVAIAHVFE